MQAPYLEDTKFFLSGAAIHPAPAECSRDILSVLLDNKNSGRLGSLGPCPVTVFARAGVVQRSPYHQPVMHEEVRKYHATRGGWRRISRDVRPGMHLVHQSRRMHLGRSNKVSVTQPRQPAAYFPTSIIGPFPLHFSRVQTHGRSSHCREFCMEKPSWQIYPVAIEQIANIVVTYQHQCYLIIIQLRQKNRPISLSPHLTIGRRDNLHAATCGPYWLISPSASPIEHSTSLLGGGDLTFDSRPLWFSLLQLYLAEWWFESFSRSPGLMVGIWRKRLDQLQEASVCPIEMPYRKDSKLFPWLLCMQFNDPAASENHRSCAPYGQLIIIQLLSWSSQRAPPMPIHATSILIINISKEGEEGHRLHGTSRHGSSFGLYKAPLTIVLPHDSSYMHCFVLLPWSLKRGPSLDEPTQTLYKNTFWTWNAGLRIWRATSSRMRWRELLHDTTNSGLWYSAQRQPRTA